MENCKGNYGTSEQKENFLNLLKTFKGNKNELINVLQKTQDIYGYLPEHLVKKISSALDVPLSEVYGVITFYTQFSLVPRATYTIDLCLGTACFVNGADQILQKLSEKLNLKAGELSADGKWMISTCRCIGCCGLAPVIRINDRVYGKVKPEEIDGILKEYGA